MMSFSRTRSGKTAKFLFYHEPLVWVEGRSDLQFYDYILRDLSCRLEVADGKSECLKLANALAEKQYPYVVVIDGDYMILERKRSWHRRVVLLHRYSSENYLFEKDALVALFYRYSATADSIGDIEQEFEELLERIDDRLRYLLILDIAHVRGATANKALPESAEAILKTNRWPIRFSVTQIDRYCLECERGVGNEQIEQAEALLEGFLQESRMVDILPGHFVFALLRRFLFDAVAIERGRKPNVDNDSLRMLLTAEVWNINPNLDHRSLRRRLRRAVREARKMRHAIAWSE